MRACLRNALPWISIVLSLSCGGNVVVDHGGGGGGESSASGKGGSGGVAGSGGAGAGSPSCDAPVIAPSNGGCFTNDGACNPVTNAPCDAGAGQACDIGPSGFQCFATGNAQALCTACNNVGGPFCAATLTCLSDGLCTRYCCSDGDCGSGRCDTSDAKLAGTGVGVCKAK